MLAACLPGKKQEEKVIAQAQLATQQVAAERLAADMSNAAQSLMASNNLNPDATPSLQSKELQTMKCLDGKRVIAYIPRGSKIAKGGELSKTVATHIRDQLQAQFSAKAVGTNSLVGECGGDPETVAINAPVLVLDNVSADLSAEQGVTSVNVASCPDVEGKSVPGVIVTKTKKDGTTVTEKHCGKPIEKLATSDKNDQNITYDLSSNSVPDWKQQLLGTAGATTSFKCIVRTGANTVAGSSSKCVNVSDANMGDRTQCDDSKQTEDFVVNPLKDNPKVSGPATAGNCGKGWTGQVVARVRSKQCKIFHGDKASDFEPAMIYDVSNVAVKCSKDDVVNIPSQCPSGTGSFYAGYQHVDMVDPVMLEPQYDSKGNPQPSLIATPDSPNLDASSLDRIRTLTNSGDVFKPSVNLRTITASDPEKASELFSTALIHDMGSRAALKNLNKCNVVNNGCTEGAGPPDRIIIVLDRSASMGSTDSSEMLRVAPSMVDGYSCQAGLSNIFNPNDSKDACSAAKEFVHLNPYQPVANESRAPAVMDFVLRPWAGGKEPDANSQVLYQKMQDALLDKTFYSPYLQYALATGWDCSGRAQKGTDKKEAFAADMFGTCSGAISCGSCPGSCQKTEIAQLPENSAPIQRVEAADIILKSLARLNLKENTQVTLAAFMNDAPNLQTMTYCPPDHEKNGVCDLTLERDALINLLTRANDVVQYVRPISQVVTIPTDLPKVPKISIVPDTRHEAGRYANNTLVWQAPANSVITGRFHQGDETQGTAFEYAALKAVDDQGKTVPGRVTVENLQWSAGIQESNDNNGCKHDNALCGIWFNVAAGQAIVGMRHNEGNGDENKNTYYLYGTVKFYHTGPDGVEKAYTVTSGESVYSGPWSESDREDKGACKSNVASCTGKRTGIFYRAAADSIMTGRMHAGDENGATTYREGALQSDCPSDVCPVKVCDVSQCAKLPAVVASDDWETWDDANAKGTLNNRGDYEMGNCGSMPKQYCSTPGNGGGGRDPNINEQSFLDLINPIKPAFAMVQPGDDGQICTNNPKPTHVFNTNEDSNYYYYCAKRRLRMDWVTAEDAKAANSFDASVKPAPDYQDNGNYQFRTCTTIEDCTKVQHTCDTSKKADDCAAAASCKASLQTKLNAVKDQWLTASVDGDCVDDASCENKSLTYCSERLRKPNASSDNANLAACLDKCPAKVVGEEQIKACNNVKDLFTGEVKTTCDLVTVPSELNYIYSGYDGKSVRLQIKRNIPSQAGEFGAVQAAEGSTWGADYGGNTPLYATIDKMFNDDGIKQDMAAKKSMAVIVLTDGGDTNGSANTTSLCKNENTSFITQLLAKDQNIRTFFVSLNDSSAANTDCSTSPDNGKKFTFVNQNSIDNSAAFKPLVDSLNSGQNGAGSAVVSEKAAEKFCSDTYGSFYKDTSVPVITQGATILPSRPAICRPYEVLK
jgi:hypothetical protein